MDRKKSIFITNW